MAGGIMLAGESCERAASVRFHIQRNPVFYGFLMDMEPDAGYVTGRL